MPECLFKFFVTADNEVDVTAKSISMIHNWRFQFTKHSHDKLVTYDAKILECKLKNDIREMR